MNSKTTFDSGIEPPKYEVGLPDEIHIWGSNKVKGKTSDLFVLRDGKWHLWKKGVAIKDVGKD